MNRKDLKNKVFGRLTVLEYSYTMIGRIRRNNPIDKILEHEKCV